MIQGRPPGSPFARRCGLRTFRQELSRTFMGCVSAGIDCIASAVGYHGQAGLAQADMTKEEGCGLPHQGYFLLRDDQVMDLLPLVLFL